MYKEKHEIRCVNYCGVTCVNGQCPNILAEIYEEIERCTCEDCAYYRGCKDCCFADKNDNCTLTY